MIEDKKIVVPKGMLEAFFDEAHDGPRWNEEEVTDMLAAALRWLSENPIVPNDEYVEGVIREHSRTNVKWACVEWQRRMFLAPEPKFPEEVGDLCWNESPAPRNEPRDEEGAGVHARKLHNKQLAEAYQRGQKAGSK